MLVVPFSCAAFQPYLVAPITLCLVFLVCTVSQLSQLLSLLYIKNSARTPNLVCRVPKSLMAAKPDGEAMPMTVIWNMAHDKSYSNLCFEYKKPGQIPCFCNHKESTTCKIQYHQLTNVAYKQCLKLGKSGSYRMIFQKFKKSLHIMIINCPAN